MSPYRNSKYSHFMSLQVVLIHTYIIPQIEHKSIKLTLNFYTKRGYSCTGIPSVHKKEKKGKDLYDYHSGRYSPLPLCASETRSIAVTFAYGNCG